jgi:oxygen-independent coproporphyrinogen III oxidase
VVVAAELVAADRGSAVAPAPPVALYVHVPFCVSLCPYCDFVVYAGAAARGPRARIADFLEAVQTEIDLRADALDEDFGSSRPALESVYIGGGTPSLLPGDDVERLLARVRERFGIAEAAEVTLEANPGPDERGDPAAWRRAGITRISFGAQSLDDVELRRLGRRHRAWDVAAAVAGAREARIDSVNLDLLYDTPGGTLATWTATLTTALELAPDHLSLYALTLEDPDGEGLTGPGGDHLPTTRGAHRWRERARLAQDEDGAAAQYEHATSVLAGAGFRGYEISNWARPGHESRHNLAYWQRRPYEAVGPGAHAFDGAVRRWNAARLDGYLRALTGSRPVLPPGGVDPVDGRLPISEALILGLRLDTGVPLVLFPDPFLAATFEWARAAALLDLTPDERVVLTTRGRLLSNEVFARLV